MGKILNIDLNEITSDYISGMTLDEIGLKNDCSPRSIRVRLPDDIIRPCGTRKTKKKRICDNCGNEFETWDSEIKRRGARFCSKRCYYDSLRKKVNYRTCMNCGKKFRVFPSSIKKGNGKFCENECFLQFKSAKVIRKKCIICGKEFRTYPSRIQRGDGKYCSNKCSGIGLSGENSPAWKGGTSFEPYCPLFDENLKERVREFWDRKCALCGKSEKENGKKLSVHHVNYDKNACCNTVPRLFVPLCGSCHSRTNVKRDYWEEMFSNYIMIWFNGDNYIKKN